ncbi:uncharacterized protein LOC132743401 [Ruditapes philippinarum]|uniref:uncharacterized protein LOC132743401 n=1 Tax=Ruditapes philippinarum TaxID=129788 RepID=UPI00295BADFB|nr:uncharacterized protein LOC132743401 [Ruditapes philippinarum]
MNYSRYVYFVYLCLTWIIEVASGRLPDITITEVSSLSPKKISLQWTPTFVPKKGQSEYVIRYKVKGGTYMRAYSKKTEVIIKDLLPDTTYVMAVRMVNSKTRGDWSDTVEIKTKSRSTHSNDDVFSNITVEEITETAVILNWTISKNIHQIKDFADFQIILKSRDLQQKQKTKLFGIVIQDLIPDTSYAANLYIILGNGKKIRTGRTKFQTLELQRKPPRKLKVKSVTQKAIAVKWKHIKPSSGNESLSGYVLEYKQKGSDSTDACSVAIVSTKKSFKIQGLLPDMRYSVRVAGVFNDVTGPFTEWLRVKTLETTEENQDVLVYCTSPTSVMLLWQLFPGMTNVSSIKVKVSTRDERSFYVEQNVLVDSKEFVVDGDKSVIEVNDLIPETRYQVTLEFRGINNHCKQYKMQNFVTVEAKCVEGCIIQPLNESYIYESYLRMIPLPNDIYLVTWQYYRQFTNQSEFKYVIRVLGEPFLNQLSANLVPNGNRYSLLTQLNRSKTYTINLQVFSSSHGGRPLASQYLLVMPMSEIWHGDMKEISNVESSIIYPWSATSIDIIMNLIDRNETALFETFDSYDVQNIPEANITLLSKLNVEETWAGNISTTPIVPQIHPMEDVVIQEDKSLVITCFAQGDPYPMTSLLNISSNQTLGGEGN